MDPKTPEQRGGPVPREEVSGPIGLEDSAARHRAAVGPDRGGRGRRVILGGVLEERAYGGGESAVRAAGTVHSRGGASIAAGDWPFLVKGGVGGRGLPLSRRRRLWLRLGMPPAEGHVGELPAACG